MTTDELAKYKMMLMTLCELSHDTIEYFECEAYSAIYGKYKNIRMANLAKSSNCIKSFRYLEILQQLIKFKQIKAWNLWNGRYFKDIPSFSSLEEFELKLTIIGYQ